VAQVFDSTGLALHKKLDDLAATVCEADPRTCDQRRADAIDALVSGANRMVCRCESDECGQPAVRVASRNVVIHVVAEQAAMEGRSTQPGFIAGSDVLIPAEILRELAETAHQRPIISPVGAVPEPHHDPSRPLADYVRCRDLTCRAPGCDVPAVVCDVDHTIPYDDGGQTHASNLKLLCRKHHLLKTFWDWRDEQLPDGTVIWTLPDGSRHVTTPGSALLFPSLCASTGSLPAPQSPIRSLCGERSVMMPRRERTRAHSQAQAIADERRHNRQRRLARSLWPTDYFDAPVTCGEDPPPF
ncbi:MAG TPA: DUF222 domain-containing protein, partial [Mycobacterium sp.]|nr:DUF222 domain-containing protein [Mycobacterium sp.]